MTGLADEDIRKEVLGLGSLVEKDVNETTCLIEAKEMTRNAMTQPAITASVFSYKSLRKSTQKLSCNTLVIFVVSKLKNLFEF